MKEVEENFGNLCVLVIEDNLGDFILIEDYLLEKFKQPQIVHFSDYATSIDFLEETKEQVSVILLDLHLPDRKGMDLINSLLQHNFRIPIIILTGYADLELSKKSLQIGVYDYLIKDELNPAILYKTIVFSVNRSSFINQIEDEKQNYENLFHFNPQPTWLLESKSLKIINANLAAQKKYAYSLESFLAMSFTDLHPADEKSLIEEALLFCKENNSKQNFTHILNNNNEIKVNIYSREIKTKKSSTFIVQSNDISETLNHINTIELQNKALTNIAWTQSHVFRAPLARTLGIVNLLEDHPECHDELSFWLAQLKNSAYEMDSIVKKIVENTISFNKE